jgi:hypothetical protein
MRVRRVRSVLSRPQRRGYRKDNPIVISSIEFVPMSERERQQAIAVLAELFMPLVHRSPRHRGRPGDG